MVLHTFVGLGAAAVLLAFSWGGPQPTGAVEPPRKQDAAVEQEPSFPMSWFGSWEGPAQVIRPGGPAMDFTMGMEIGPGPSPGVCAWTIIYDGAGNRQERRYELITRDAAAGRYAVDEKSGIVLPATFIGGSLYSQFEVEQRRITATYRLETDKPGAAELVIEMITTDAAHPEKSGGDAGVPAVIASPALVVQRAVLTRKP